VPAAAGFSHALIPADKICDFRPLPSARGRSCDRLDGVFSAAKPYRFGNFVSKSVPAAAGFHALIPADKICDFVGSFRRVGELCSPWWCFFGGKATEKTD